MTARVQSYALAGLEGVPVTVEADISKGMPSYEIVGLPDAAVKESKERVRSAVKNSGFEFPAHRVTVNLAPAYVRKEGSAFDLAIAVCLLRATGALQADAGGTVLLGELALSGELRPVQGVLPALIAARDNGFTDFVVPAANAGEAGYIRGIRAFAAADLKEVVGHLSGAFPLSPVPAPEFPPPSKRGASACDLAFVKGQPVARRALEVAVAGGHNILFVGPPADSPSDFGRGTGTGTAGRDAERRRDRGTLGGVSEGGEGAGGEQRAYPRRVGCLFVRACRALSAGEAERGGGTSARHRQSDFPGRGQRSVSDRHGPARRRGERGGGLRGFVRQTQPCSSGDGAERKGSGEFGAIFFRAGQHRRRGNRGGAARRGGIRKNTKINFRGEQREWDVGIFGDK